MRRIIGYLLVLVSAAVLSGLFFGGQAHAEWTGGPGMDTRRFFTITDITLSPNKEQVALTFSAPCEVEKLRKWVKIYPFLYTNMWNQDSGNTMVFVVRASFKPGQAYTVYLPEGVECGGRKYQKTLDSLKTPDLPADINIAEHGSVIERYGRRMVHLNITNVGEVLVQGLDVPLILAPYLNNISSHTYADVKSTAERSLNELRPIIAANPALREFAGEIVEKRNIIPAGDKQNNPETFSIPLDFTNDNGSVIVFSIGSNINGHPAQAGHMLMRITDIGLTYKLSDSGLLIWATSLNTGEPLAGVSLLAFASNNTVIPLGKTDKDGLAVVRDFEKLPAISLVKNGAITQPALLKDIRLILAASASDKTYAEISPSNFIRPDWVSQSKAYSDTGKRLLKGHLFTERGIYRPGETVYFKGTVREFKDGYVRPPADLTPVIKIVNSKDEKVYEESAALSEFGTASGSLVIKPYFPYGTYTLTMSFPGGNGEASKTFQVQEFQPPRHFTEIRFRPEKKKDKRYRKLDKEMGFLNAEINGVYYAGGPVKNGKLRWKIYYNPTDFRKPKYKDYAFGNTVERQEELVESGESTLDEKGAATVNVPLSKDVSSGILGLRVVATVVDFDGKAATESSVYQEEPGWLVGIGAHKDSITAGETEALKLIIIDKDGKKVEEGRLTAEVLRRSYTYIRKRNESGNVYWSWEEMFRKELKTVVAVEKGVGLFDFDFAYGGNYIVRFTYNGADGKAYTSSTAYNVAGDYYGYEYNNKDRNFEKLSVSTEASEYAPGETIRVFVNPHRKLASLLMTIERQGIIESRLVTVTEKKNYVDIPVQKGYEPNVYVSFLGTVARGEFPVYNGAFDDEAPTFLFGVVNANIKRDPGELKVTISDEVAELKAEPGMQVDLRLISKNGAGIGVRTEMAVAVVDESVLNMTGFETPTLDTLGKFIASLSVFTLDTRAELLKQTPFHVIGKEELTGGDGMSGRPEAATSKVRKDFNPVAYFNPAIVTDKDGSARVSFKLPDTMTTYRVYVVSVDKGHGFASAQRGLLAVKDFYLEPGTPRFFIKGDRFKMHVAAFNKTKKASAIQFSIGQNDLVSLTTPRLNYDVESMDRTLVPVEGTAVNTGVSKLLFSGKLKDKSDAVEISVPVNSGYLMANDVVFGVVSNGAKIRYNLPEGTDKIDWKDAKPDAITLTISGSPFMRLTPGLKYLLRYPYGCVEQTSSGVLPLAGLRGLIKDGLISEITLDETDKFLKPGIARLLSMQTASGGFGYWQGDLNPHRWGSVYASMALTAAKLAGADVPADQLVLAMKYLKAAALDKTDKDMTYAGYAAYILALNAGLDRPFFDNAYKDMDRMSREGALLLLLAAKTMNFMTDAEVTRTARPLLERRWDYNGRDVFYARYREPAVSLMAATAIMPGEAVAGSLASQLLGGMNKQGIWTSTSDTGWSLLALGGYFKGLSFTGVPIKVSVRQEGWPETTVTLDPVKAYTYQLEPGSFLKKPEVTIVTQAGAALTYALALTYPRVDYAKDGFSNGFTVKKRIENTGGSKAIKVGDVVKVTLDIDVAGDDFNYVVLDDPLPAGFVAVNSAIKTEEYIPKRERNRTENEGDGEDSDYSDDSDWYYYRWSSWDDESGAYRFVPSYFEIRDDRVLVFKNRVWKGRYRYSYYARAICEGEFTLPSSKVQLMYDPKTVSYTPAGKVVVEGSKAR